MKIKKLGHCCLVLEIAPKNSFGQAGIKIMTDPGSYSTAQDSVTGVDLILITHEHPDHLHIESLKKVLENNPTAKIITNSSVGKILEQEKIEFQIVSDGEQTIFQEISIKGFGTRHAEIFEEMGQVENTGYLLNDFFYPGDAFTDPQTPIEILALLSRRGRIELETA